uniref:DUF7731 domain-containing protein n=2 Tax=Cajanus cajan TaxID=3821 RepID=A0A151U126_CAJCA|nr:hypothetical protein KK1_005592 [Cajanus cajan]
MKDNDSTPCLKGGYSLTIAGALIVSDSDISDFCINGCYDHIRSVLDCIQDVKRDFFFATKQPVSYVMNVTKAACSSKTKGFNTNVTKANPNSATSLYGRLYMPLVSTLTTAAFIATYGV